MKLIFTDIFPELNFKQICVRLLPREKRDTLKVRSMQKIKVSTSGFTLHFFFVSFRFSASVAEEMFSVLPFIIAWLVCVSVSFFIQRRGNGRIRILFEYTFEYTCRRFFRTMENAYSLTRAAIQL